MNVSLTPELEQFIQAKLEGGRYRSASEVVREALRLLSQHDRLEAMRLDDLRQAVGVGIDQFDRGEGRVFDRRVVEKIKSVGRKRLKEQGAKRPA